MELNKKVRGIIGAAVLVIVLAILSWQKVISITDISTPIVAAIVAGIVSFLSWGFSPEIPRPKFHIEVNDASEPSRQHTRLLTFDIWNKGGGLSAINPTVVCKVEEGKRKEYAVQWRQANVPINDEIPSPEIIQSWLDNSLFTASKIDHQGHETIELLFTTDHNALAYFLDSNKTQLPLGKHYTVTLKVKATDVKAHVRRFDVDLTQWDTVKATEIT